MNKINIELAFYWGLVGFLSAVALVVGVAWYQPELVFGTLQRLFE